jgi:predicted peroxiredoxin
MAPAGLPLFSTVEEVDGMGFVYLGTHATDDPTKATLPFVTALGGKQVEEDVSIVLLGEAVGLVKEAVSPSVHGVGFPPLEELMAAAGEAQIPVHV